MGSKSLLRQVHASVLLRLLSVVAIALVVTQAHSQMAGTASVQGAITDGSGAAIQNASVTATNSATQVQHATRTGTDGLYSFPNIAIGSYSIDVEASGFQ